MQQSINTNDGHNFIRKGKEYSGVVQIQPYALAKEKIVKIQI
jgi:hypothetical protein